MTALNIGQTVPTDQFATLPIGSQVRGIVDDAETWTKQADGRWNSARGRNRVRFNQEKVVISIPRFLRPGAMCTEPGDFDLLPPGTVLTATSDPSTPRFIKVGDNWDRTNTHGQPAGLHAYTSQQMGSGHLVLTMPCDDILIPSAWIEPNLLTVGSVLTEQTEVRNLPVGTTIHVNGPDRYQKTDWCKWEHVAAAEGRTPTPAVNPDSTFTGWIIAALPEGHQVQPNAGIKETLEQFKQRFRLAAMGQAVSSGISMNPVHTALATLGVEERPLGPGCVIPSRYVHYISGLPSGTILYQGDPDSGTTVWEWRNGDLKQLLGNGSIRSSLVIETIPGVTEPPDWLKGEPTEEDEQAIAEFKAKAWRVGVKAKAAQGWCSSFETAMQAVGINENCLNGYEHVGMVPASTVTRFPEGTILRFADRNGTWGYVVRDNSATNRARTKRLFGRRVGSDARLGHFREFMEVVYRPGEESWHIPLSTKHIEELAHLPVGTRIATNPGDSYFYTKVAENNWEYSGGGDGYGNDAFSDAFKVVHLPINLPGVNHANAG